jgi:hypothetical protein
LGAVVRLAGGAGEFVVAFLLGPGDDLVEEPVFRV